jgi:membrane protease YdiL (CAAX protease family)
VDDFPASQLKKEKKMNNSTSPPSNDQYSLAKILGIWAIVALPLVLASRIVVPLIVPYIDMHPGIVFWWVMILGMAWQFVVSMWIVKREEGDLRWATIRRRFWLNKPRDSKTGEPKAKLFWWLVPGILLTAFISIALVDYLNAPLAWLFPSLTTPLYSDMADLATPEFVGAWWLMGIALISAIFNYFLGEEFLFRGVLLPKMEGVFGKWDWVANAVLFGLYHIHWAPSILSIIVIGLPGIWLSRRFRCNWMYIVIHGFEGIFMFLGILGTILGMA